MLRSLLSVRLLCTATLIAALGSAPGATAADKDTPKKKDGGTVTGIYIVKNDKEKSITVRVDGEEDTSKFLIGDATDKKARAALGFTQGTPPSVFDASRVKLTYKMNGEDRELVSIERQVGQLTGTFTGVVVDKHNDFWIEVKPAKKGLPPDAFALSGPLDKKEVKDIQAKVKDLEKGDTVTIQFTTDFERHRMTSLKVEKPKK